MGRINSNTPSAKSSTKQQARALIYTGLGEKDQAFDWLEKAYEERQPYFNLFKVEPVFDSLRSDPRFVSLLKRIGFAA